MMPSFIYTSPVLGTVDAFRILDASQIQYFSLPRM
jgi:hypothetical protein